MFFKKINQNPISWILLSILGVVWGSSFLSIKYAIIAFEPIQISSLRIIIGFFIVFLFSLIFKIEIFNIYKPKRYWLLCTGVAVLSNLLPFTILAIAQVKFSTIFVGLCMAIIPLLITIFSLFLFKYEPISSKKLFGILIGLSGSALLVMSKASEDLDNNQEIHFIFLFLCILAPISYSFGAMIIKKADVENLLSFTTHALFIASVLSLPFLIKQGLLPNKIDLQSIFAILYLGIIPTGIATIILVYLIKKEGPIFLSLVNYKVPLWSTIFGFLLLKEMLPNNFFLASFLILSGIIICQSKKV